MRVNLKIHPSFQVFTGRRSEALAARCFKEEEVVVVMASAVSSPTNQHKGLPERKLGDCPRPGRRPTSV